MSLLNYFDRKKATGCAPPLLVVNDSTAPPVTVAVSSSSEEDPVYVEVVEKTKRIIAKRKPAGLVDVDRSSVRDAGGAGDDRQPVALIQEPYRPTWSQRIAPQSAAQVLGNEHSVGELLSWLKAWKKRRKVIKDVPSPDAASKRQQKSRRKKRKRRKRPNTISSSSSSSEDDWCNADPDFKPATRQVRNKMRRRKRGHSDDEEDWLDADEVDGQQLCSTVLLTGPHGCGKTAAVFACAQELGYEVLEINASSLRSGKQVMSLLQEATQSHQVSKKNVDGVSNAGSSKAATNAMRNFFKPPTPAATTPKQCHASPDPSSSPSSLSPNAKAGFAGPSLILFEEVDILFEEDKGFWTALTSVAEASKRPIVITALVDCLPAGLPYLSFPLAVPAPHTVSALLHDKSQEFVSPVATVTRDDISFGVSVCNGDLRRAMLNFDLWMSTGQVSETAPDSFKSWMLQQVDARTRLAMEFAETRQSLLQHSLSAPADAVSPRERFAQLDATVTLLEAQSAVDSLCAPAFASRPKAFDPYSQPPSLSWQPAVSSWWPGAVLPGLLDTAPVVEADAISRAHEHGLSNDIGGFVGDIAVGHAAGFVSSAEYSNLPPSDDSAKPLVGYVNLDSGIASSSEESVTLHAGAAGGAKTARFSTLSAAQESEFQSRRLFYAECLRWPHMPDIAACHSRTVALDYLPTLRLICRDQQMKKVNRVKRRFIHHFNTLESEIAIRLAQDHMLC